MAWLSWVHFAAPPSFLSWSRSSEKHPPLLVIGASTVPGPCTSWITLSGADSHHRTSVGRAPYVTFGNRQFLGVGTTVADSTPISVFACITLGVLSHGNGASIYRLPLALARRRYLGQLEVGGAHRVCLHKSPAGEVEPHHCPAQSSQMTSLALFLLLGTLVHAEYVVPAGNGVGGWESSYSKAKGW